MNSIRRRLTRRLLLALSLLVAAGLAAIYIWTRAALVAEFDRVLHTKAMAISTVTEEEPGRVKVEFTDRFMREFGEKVATDFFEMWRSDGRVIKRSGGLGQDDLPRRVGSLNAPRYWRLKLPNGLPARAIGIQFLPKREHDMTKDVPSTQVDLVVAVDRRPLDERLAVLQVVLGSCGLLLLAAVTAIVPGVLRRELKPLDRLAEEAGRITADSLSRRFTAAGLPGELRPIAQRLNDLLARLETSFERERRFSADLAHELRTPLAELRSMAECALKWPQSRGADVDRETLEVARQMEGIVNRLLALARSEGGELPLHPEPVAIAALIEKTWQPLAERAARKRLHAEFRLQPATVTADPVLLQSILANLLENAVEYTPEGGRILVETEAGPAEFALRVGNTVENLEAADVPRLFERFWRKEASRTAQEHAGLGLALAREFSRALGGRLDAQLDGRGSLVFSLAGLRPVRP